MSHRGTIKLYVNRKFVTQRKVNSKLNMKEIIERWKKMYALEKHNYDIYIHFPSKMNDK